ncbi:MAG: hypothetical protein OHK0045_09220 [Raineya sp.]
MKKNKSLRYKIRVSLLLLSGLLAFYWIYFVFLGVSLSGIDTANQLKREILSLSKNKQYKEVIKKSFYVLHLDSSQQDIGFWNLASAYYMLNQKQIAQNFYDTLSKFAPINYRARSLHQKGNTLYLLSLDSSEAALQAYKSALYLQESKDTRYNYELLKKIQEKNTPLLQQKGQEKKPNSSKPNKEPKQNHEENENKNHYEDFLEAISNQEQEQIRKYQLKKVKNANSSLPDW